MRRNKRKKDKRQKLRRKGLAIITSTPIQWPLAAHPQFLPLLSIHRRLFHFLQLCYSFEQGWARAGKFRNETRNPDKLKNPEPGPENLAARTQPGTRVSGPARKTRPSPGFEDPKKEQQPWLNKMLLPLASPDQLKPFPRRL